MCPQLYNSKNSSASLKQRRQQQQQNYINNSCFFFLLLLLLAAAGYVQDLCKSIIKTWVFVAAAAAAATWSAKAKEAKEGRKEGALMKKPLLWLTAWLPAWRRERERLGIMKLIN